MKDKIRAIISGLALLLCCASAARADVKIDAEHFPDEGFRCRLLSMPYGADSVLTDEEIAKIWILHVAKRGIRSLKGIEYFTALEVLIAGDNEIEELDLSGHTVLGMLYCGGNRLRKLDVSGCTSLYQLCCERNQLGSIGTRGCSDLKDLKCYGNRIAGEAMDSLLASLRPSALGKLYVVGDDDEQNVLTTRQAAAAVYKGWRPYRQTAGGEWTEYLGSSVSE